jgi:hypothetical protein
MTGQPQAGTPAATPTPPGPRIETHVRMYDADGALIRETVTVVVEVPLPPAGTRPGQYL